MYEMVFKASESFSICSVKAVPFCAKHFSIHERKAWDLHSSDEYALYQARASLLSSFSLDHTNQYDDEWESSSGDLFPEHFYIKLPSDSSFRKITWFC